jgi:hypothetical protein
MPESDFAKVDDAPDFTPIPEGKYLCRLAGIEVASTRRGDEMWKLRFEVAGGPYARRIIFDNLVFSKADLKLAKLLCSRLDLDVSKVIHLTPALVMGREINVTVGIEPSDDLGGRIKHRNVVPFAGYERAGTPKAGPADQAPATMTKSQEEPPYEAMPF